ncbi:hypothetical protein BDN72DRAFT_845502 [Pluteus cervinus]|uniref:Uncharacterized protein n=1 Tax=Pluteus cervinus TaxID=181527 RepID=A0ACD3AIB3_9AGAR|nr:hypothetical protein BDN72DRAFT_845502 [Pluteus cervinus]
MDKFVDENLVHCANSNVFQYYDSGAGTGRVDMTCALASFIVTVVDVEEKGYDERTR